MSGEPLAAAGHRDHPPFFTAGGTSVLMLYLCMGLALSVYTHNKRNLFDG